MAIGLDPVNTLAMLGPELIGIGNRFLVKGGIAIRVNKCRFCQICAWLKDHVLFHEKTPSTILNWPNISALFYGCGFFDVACQRAFTQSHSKLVSQPVRISKACDNDRRFKVLGLRHVQVG